MFDKRIPEIISGMREDDILMITADHGCDPTFPGCDHTREHIPLLICGDRVKANSNLGVRECFADIAETIFDVNSLKGIIIDQFQSPFLIGMLGVKIK